MVLRNANVYGLRLDWEWLHLSRPTLPLLYKMLICTLILWFCWKREHNSQSSVARNGNTRRLMVARGALCPAVDCQIKSNKEMRQCPASRESNSARQAKPQAQQIIIPPRPGPTTKHDGRHSPRTRAHLPGHSSGSDPHTCTCCYTAGSAEESKSGSS